MRSLLGLPRRLHRDEHGSISILSVFAVLLLTMLLGMVMNVGRHVDGKIRMQNAADDVAYSGGVVIARGLNTLTFSNHLLCEVFAMTAIMREARERNSDRYLDEILEAWRKVGQLFQQSKIAKFQTLGAAIIQKIPLEKKVCLTFGDWMFAASERVLPVFEEILQQEMIPQFQRAVVQVYPEIAQMAAREVAYRDGQPNRGRGPMLGFLWRTNGMPVGGDAEMADPTFPVIDPSLDPAAEGGKYYTRARSERYSRSHELRNLWNTWLLLFFDGDRTRAINGKVQMCQFGNLWRNFTCGQLNKLLEEYPNRNLPFVLRDSESEAGNANVYLDQYFTFVAVVYWRKLPEMGPGVFANPIESDAQAFSQVRVFIPKSRLIWSYLVPSPNTDYSIGGLPGPPLELPPDLLPPSEPQPQGKGHWEIVRQPVPMNWSLFNQSWKAQLVPATAAGLVAILQTPPPSPEFQQAQLRVPNLGRTTTDDLRRINTH